MAMDLEAARPRFMYGFYHHFNNLRFNKSRNLNDYSAAHVVVSFVSSELMKCRLLKCRIRKAQMSEKGEVLLRGVDTLTISFGPR